MKKHTIFAALASASMIFTACGTNSEMLAETTDSAISVEETTLNFATEMTVPPYSPDENVSAAVSQTEVTTVEIYTEKADVTTVVTTETVLETVTETSAETISPNLSEESTIFEAEVLSVNENSVFVKMSADTFIGTAGTEVYIDGTYSVEMGDIVNIVFTEEVEINESYPPEIPSACIISLEAVEYAENYDIPYDSGEDLNDGAGIPDIALNENEVLAEVTACSEIKNGSYSLTVTMFYCQGYGYDVPLTLKSDNAFEVGDWVKIEFAEETCFMESSPLQVSKSDVLSVEKVQ